MVYIFKYFDVIISHEMEEGEMNRETHRVCGIVDEDDTRMTVLRARRCARLMYYG